MNKFEETFFKKYIPQDSEIIQVFHKHFIKVADSLVFIIWIWVIIPVFLYYNSYLFQKYINFLYLEIYLIFVYILTIYKLFDWYNDVLILSKDSITKLKWSLFKNSVENVDLKYIEWIEINKKNIWDKVFRKWDIMILKFWDEELVFEEASNPYKVLNEIEKSVNYIKSSLDKTKFDLMMDTLGWIVEDYLWKEKEDKDLKEKEKENILKNVEEKDSTIDLR